jgi:hypothetical protein
LLFQGDTGNANAMSSGPGMQISQRWDYRYNKLGFKGIEYLKKHLAGSLTPV